MSESSTKSITALEATKVLPILWVIGCAWPYGGATWLAQQWISFASLLVLAFTVILTLATKRKIAFGNSAAIFMAIFATLGFFTILQTLPCKPQSSSLTNIPVFKLQTSFLEPKSLESVTDLNAAETTSADEVSHQITISVDRGHSLAAVSNLGIAIIAFAVGYLLIGSSTQLAFVALILITVNCATVAAFGIAEDIAANKWQLLNIDSATAFAPFVSKNSAAMFLNLGLACGFGAIGCQPSGNSTIEADPTYRYSSSSIISKVTHLLEEAAADISSVKLAIASAMVLLLVGVLFTLSRGGMASAFAAFLVVAGVALFRVRKVEGTLLVCGLFLAAAFIVVWLEELAPIAARIETVTEGSALLDDTRWTVWNFASRTFQSLWLTGGGLGNFHYSYLPFQDKPLNAWFYHAESFYWQTAVDLGFIGVLGIVCGLLVICRTLSRLLKQTSNKATLSIASTLVFMIAALSLHSLAEFSLILPGIYVPACTVIGIAFAMSETHKSKRARRSKKRSRLELAKDSRKINKSTRQASTIFLAIAFGLVLVGTYFNRPRIAADSIQHRLTQWSFDSLEAETTLNSILRDGEAALQKYPNDGQLNLVMGKAYIEKFRWQTYRQSPQGRLFWDATHPQVFRAQFFYRSKRENISFEAFLNDPERVNSLVQSLDCWRKAHFLLPLDWRPHFSLAELDFVRLDTQQTSFHLNKLQTLALNRPKVLTNSGIIALAYPGPDEAFPIFKRALACSPDQISIIFPIALKQYGTRVVAEPFLPLHAPTLLQLANSYSSVNPNPLIVDGIWKQISAALPLMPDSNRQKPLIAAEAFRREGNIQGEISSLRTAVTLNPLNTDIRFQYAQALLKDNQTANAREQINTCIRQQPKKMQFQEFRDSLDESLPPLPATF